MTRGEQLRQIDRMAIQGLEGVVIEEYYDEVDMATFLRVFFIPLFFYSEILKIFFYLFQLIIF